MTSLSLLAKIYFDVPKETWGWGGGFSYINKAYNLLLLKDGSLIIYTNSKISLLTKNFNWKDLISFKESKNLNCITSIKEIKNRKILICAEELYVAPINPKFKEKIKKITIPNGEKILDTIELKNGKIFGISSQSIFEIKIEQNVEILQLFKMPQKWLIKSFESRDRFYSRFKQYMNVYELPNNRLLINSHSTEMSHNGGCGTHPPYEVSINKMYIIDLENFQILHEFQKLTSEINIIILDKYICIIYYYRYHMKNIIDIYSIDDYKLIKKIEDRFEKNYIIPIDNNKIISMSEKEKKNDLIIYDLSNINDIKYKIFKGDFIKFKTKHYNGIYEVRNTKNKSICILKNGSLFIICHGLIYIVDFHNSLDSLPFDPLSEYEYKEEHFEYLKNIHFIGNDLNDSDDD